MDDAAEPEAGIAHDVHLPPLTLFQKISFGAAAFPAGLISNIKGFFLNTFLLEVAGVGPYYAGILLLATKAFDAVSDPVIGRLSDRTRSRWGRRRPWLIFGAIPLALTYFGLWMVIDAPSWAKFIYYLVFVMLCDLCYTMVHIPFTAMSSEIATDYDERTRITTFVSMFTVLGGLIPPFIHSTIVEAFPSATIPHEPDYVLGYGVSAIVMGTLIIGATWWTFFGTASLRSVQQNPEKNAPPFFRALLTCLRHLPFLWLMLLYLMSWVSVMFIQNNLFLFAQIVLDCESHFSYLLLTIEISTLINLILWGRISGRIGKKPVFLLGNLSLVITVGALFFLPPGVLWLTYLIAAFAGMGVAIGLLIPWSMLPDTIDEFELKNGYRLEGTFYSVFVLFQKVGLAIGLAVSNFVLAAAGFISNPTPESPLLQPGPVRVALRLLLGPIPLVLIIFSFIFMYLYPITRERHENVMVELEKRRAVKGLNPQSPAVPARKENYGSLVDEPDEQSAP